MAQRKIDYDFVIGHYGKLSNRALAKQLGCDPSSITHLATRVGLRKKGDTTKVRPWTKADKAWVTRHWATTPNERIARRFGCPVAVITMLARRLGLPIKQSQRNPSLCCPASRKRSEMCEPCRAHWQEKSAAYYRRKLATTDRRRADSTRCCPATTKRSAMCKSCASYWREYFRNKMRSHVATRKHNNICIDCPAPALKGYVRCERCNGRRNALARQQR